MKISATIQNTPKPRQAGFTMIEVTFAAAIAALVLAGMFQGYDVAGRQTQFSACNLAANTQAMRMVEQVEGAEWVPSYGEDQLLTLGSTNTGNLCLPSANGNLINCTNYTTVTQISTSPPYVMIQAQCVWTFPTYGGTFTNTIAVLRAPNI
jgi:prepilin-type N-terminal cleavage/methylation domain-containing protein